ncbi:MAG: hypothetical protein EXR62_05675 [Chloroflexi bacterium]|nr:hypothetical protein [Chloroflexota bacterium]
MDLQLLKNDLSLVLPDAHRPDLSHPAPELGQRRLRVQPAYLLLAPATATGWIATAIASKPSTTSALPISASTARSKSWASRRPNYAAAKRLLTKNTLIYMLIALRGLQRVVTHQAELAKQPALAQQMS